MINHFKKGGHETATDFLCKFGRKNNEVGSSKLYKGRLTVIILNLFADGDQMYGYEITQKGKELPKAHIKITEEPRIPPFIKSKPKDCWKPKCSKSIIDCGNIKRTKKENAASMERRKELQPLIEIYTSFAES